MLYTLLIDFVINCFSWLGCWGSSCKVEGVEQIFRKGWEEELSLDGLCIVDLARSDSMVGDLCDVHEVLRLGDISSQVEVSPRVDNRVNLHSNNVFLELALKAKKRSQDFDVEANDVLTGS